jgi:hypothetical protein
MTFTAAELSLLKLSDRLTTERLVLGMHRGRKRTTSGGVGSLTYDEALAMHCDGRSRDEVALAAGVSPETVGIWRRMHGLTRPWVRRGTARP